MAKQPVTQDVNRVAPAAPDAWRGQAWLSPGWRRALVMVAGLVMLFYLPVLLGLRTFPDGDFTHHFLPFSQYFQRELLAGRLPVWNPHTYAGHPFLADVQAAVFYPVGDLLLLATAWLTEAGARLYFLQIEAILHVVLAGFFTYLLVREVTGSRGAALLAGAVFALSGYVTGYPPVQLAVLRTAVWLPLLLWAMVRGAAAPGRWGWWIAVGAVTAVTWLAGHPQTFLFAAYVAAAWLLLLLALIWRQARRTDQTLGQFWRTVAGVILAGAVALGLAAAQLLPSLEYVGVSVRADTSYAFVSGGFPLQDTWEMLLPGVLTEYSPLYVGVAGLGLAMLALFGQSSTTVGAATTPVMPRRVGIGFFAGVTIFALLASYGDNGFLYPLLYRVAPGWNLFRGQERAAYLVAFGLSVLSGYGAALAPAMPQQTRYRIATVYAGVVIGGVYIFGLLWQLAGRTTMGQARYLLLAAATITLAPAFALLLRLPGWSERRSALLAAIVIGNLFVANISTNLSDFGPARKVTLAPEVAAVQAAVAAAATANAGIPGRVYNEFRTYEDYSMRAGVEDVWGASPLRLATYAALFAEFPLDRMWRLTGVDHVLTWRRELFEPSTLLAEFPQATDTTYLHRLAEPNPRAWLVGQVRTVDDATATQLLADHDFDLERVALLPGEFSGEMVGAPATGSVQLAQVAPGHLRTTVSSERGGLLLFAENWMPGWRVEDATCGEVAAPCAEGVWPPAGLPYLAPVRVDLTLVGAPVPPGKVAFDLVYQPASVRWGLWISGATLVALGVLGLGAWLVRRL